MSDIRALVNDRLKFSICILLAAQFKVLFQHRLKSIDRYHEDWPRKK
jgi:hypothetical protein